MKYNMTFVTGNMMLEIKIIGMAEERGLQWRKTGMKVSIVGLDEEMRDIIEAHCDRFWGW